MVPLVPFQAWTSKISSIYDSHLMYDLIFVTWFNKVDFALDQINSKAQWLDHFSIQQYDVVWSDILCTSNINR